MVDENLCTQNTDNGFSDSVETEGQYYQTKQKVGSILQFLVITA